jgi:hypothetical protein
MNSFIFVSIICMGSNCNFVTSNEPMTQAQCQQTKFKFLSTKAKPDVTLTAAQCMKFKEPKYL